MPRLKLPPAATADQLLEPTLLGEDLATIVPSPNAPVGLLPHVHRLPSDCIPNP